MEEKSATKQIDDIIETYGGWKGKVLAEIRSVIKHAYSGVTEEIKWKMPTRPEGLPVWSHKGILCFAETWKDNVKLLFPNGTQFKDPNKLFNARLKGNTIRAIEFREGEMVNEAALSELVIEAVEFNNLKMKK